MRRGSLAAKGSAIPPLLFWLFHNFHPVCELLDSQLYEGWIWEIENMNVTLTIGIAEETFEGSRRQREKLLWKCAKGAIKVNEKSKCKKGWDFPVVQWRWKRRREKSTLLTFFVSPTTSECKACSVRFSNLIMFSRSYAKVLWVRRKSFVSNFLASISNSLVEVSSQDFG